MTNEQYPALQAYVDCQNYNVITRFFHAVRYRHLNNFLQGLKPHSNDLFEIGCGYGKSLEVIKNVDNYVGIDIDPQFAAFCQQKFPKLKFPKYQFLQADIRDYLKGIKNIPFKPTAVIALECFEHIPERDVPAVLEWIASLGCPLFISVPNEVGPALLLKNIGSALMGYSRHKEYTWRETCLAATYQVERVTRHYTGHIGFDWRWLLKVIHQYFNINKIGTSPVGFLPRFLSPSIYFYCRPITSKY